MKDDSLYKDVILEHWEHPLHYGEIIKPDIDVTDANPLCGDEIRVTAIIKKGSLLDSKFTAQGCAIAKASASMYLDYVIGKQAADIMRLTPEFVLSLLVVQLTPTRVKCALLVHEVFKKGLSEIT